jgi:uncharacterized protein YfaS (alpha-2-macroglobulin family)
MRLIANGFAFVVSLVLSPLRWLFKQIFGEFHWQAPAWFALSQQKTTQAAAWLKQNPKQGLIGFLALAMLVVGSIFGWQYYQSLPKPVVSTYQVTSPAASSYDDNGRAYPQALVVTFNESVATVSSLNKPVTEGIKIAPNIVGEWQWLDDKTLQFTPKSDWPIDAEFKVTMGKKKLFSPHIKLESYDFTFKSAPFKTSIASAEFYQDPIDANLKKLVAIVSFSHPVDAEKFRKLVEVKLDGGLSFLGLDAAANTTITFDKFKLNAFIHSAPLDIPKEDTKLKLTLKSGIQASKGGNTTETDIASEIIVPGLYSLNFNNISMTLVDNARFEPEQVLIVGSNRNVSEAALKGHVNAWLLPEFNPKTPETERKAPYPWYADEVSKEILAKSELLTLEAMPSADTQADTHSYKFKAPVGRRLYVKVDAGIQAFGGYLSQKPSLTTLEVMPYPQVVRLLSEGALLSLSGDKKLAFMTRGVKGVQIEIGRVLPNQLHHLVDQNRSGFATPDLYEGEMDKLVERMVEKRLLPVSEYGKPSYDNIDFGQYLKERSRRAGGVYMVEIKPFDPENPNSETDLNPDRRFILVTNIGIVAKKSVDGSQDVFVQSIATGEPIAGAKVEVVGRNGQAVLTNTTGADGHVRFEKLDDFRREKQALMYVVSNENDLSFLPINRYDRNLNLSRFDVGGIDNAISAQQLSAYGFTDRGIYRPGETAHIGLIVRTANWHGNLAGIPLEAEITDPRGLPVFKKSIQLNAAGFESLDFNTRETSATGEYHVGLYVVKNNQRQEEIGSTSFKVRDFEPDRLKVNVTLTQTPTEGWIKPEQAEAKVKAMHLFGSPANDRRVEAEMTLTPAFPAFAKYKDYAFQERYKLKDPFTEKLAEATTDSNGEAKLELNLKRFARATYRLHLSAKVFESGAGRGVSAEAATLISSSPYLVGVKADGELNYITRQASRNATWLAIDPDLKAIAVNHLTQVLIERKFVSVLVKQPSGVYKYESRKKESVKSSQAYALKAGANTVTLNTEEPGDYAIALRDAEGNELNRIEYSVAGEANLSRSLERNAELQLTLNKADYKAGETIEINIRAPYTGAGLITIERDRVYTHQWFKTNTTSSVQSITLPKDFEGNGYVSVQFVRDAASEEIFMSPLSYGVVPFEVNMDARREPVKISAAEVVKPGQSLAMQVSSPTPSKVVVFAVNEGILQVARYKTPNPIGFFFQKRALQVDTTQILDLVLPEFKQLMNAAAPGGDGDAVMGRHLNPFKKKHQKPVAYWSGIIESDSKGKTLQYHVPETFNGKLRIIAVSVNANKIGVAESNTEVRGDLILSANVPSMVAPQDTFTVSVGVFNNIKNASGNTPVSLSLKNSAALTALTPAKITLQVPAQQEATAEFTLRANTLLGAADVHFIAQSGSGTALSAGKAIESISVRPAAPFATKITVGRLDDKQTTAPLKRQLFAEHRDVKAGISNSPLIWTQAMEGYLSNYSYSCTEQLVSKGVPALIFTVAADKQQNVDKVVEILRERQNGDGSFGLWAANMQTAPFVSVYATHYLLEAQSRGLAVPADMLANANQWLSQMATAGSEGIAGVRTRAYAIYLLTQQGVVTSGMLATLQKELDERYNKTWQNDLTAAYVAASYQLLQQDALATKLIKRVPWLKKGAKYDETYTYYDASVHNAQRMYIIAKHFKSQLGSVPDHVITELADNISHDEYHTLSAAYMMLGLDAYGAAGGESVLNIQEINRANQTSPVALSKGIVKSGNISAKASKVLFSKSGSSPAFYMLSENGFDTKPNAQEIQEGLEIAKIFTDLKGAPISKVAVGEEFLVKLTFRATSRERVPQVAIVDLLPGGLEPVMRAASNEVLPEENYSEEGMMESALAWQAPIGEAGNSWLPEYADIRDDRVVLYGMVDRNVGSFVYRVRATNAGKFTIPAPMVEGMYNQQLRAQGKAGVLEVTKPKQ